MDIIKKRSWSSFRNWLFEYSKQDALRRQQLIFRGHYRADWKLAPTLDREFAFTSDAERQQVSEELIGQFRRELLHVEIGETAELRDDVIELLARHQGLPSPILDWTDSPYIATFFAFAACTETDKHQVAVWVMDQTKIEGIKDIKVIDDYSMLRFNRRAVRQRAVFVHLATNKPLDELAGDALTKIMLPAQEYHQALTELDEMTINATYLFSDMEAAARTAHFRVTARRS